MGLFRRRQPLHEQLAREGGLQLEPIGEGRPPGWMETGIHGVPQARRWDAVLTVEVEGVAGDEVRFVALADDTLVVEEGEDVESLAAALEESGAVPPYRAEATRRSESQWAVGIRGIDVVELPEDPGGSELTLTVHDGERTLLVDGARTYASVPALEEVGSRRARSFVVQATRLDDSIWEVEAMAL